MKIVWLSRARRRYDDQIEYLINHHAPMAAQRLQNRVAEYITNTLGGLFHRTA